MTKKRPEEIISEIKRDVTEKFLAENPLKKFPEDFLSAKAKKELAPSSPRATDGQASCGSVPPHLFFQ